MLNIAALASAYRAGTTTPGATLRALLDRIAASGLNSFISVDAAAVMREAAAADRIYASRPDTAAALCGIPVAIKDLIDVAGMRSTMGSRQYAQHVASADAAVVQRLRAHGAIIIGKANTHEFAYGSTGDRSYFGPVRNPHNPAHISGGSSSGSAAALGEGLCAGALGTDTSASIRLPAALCGVVGMKPSYDLLPREGVFALSQTLDHVGPMSVSVADNALLLDVLAERAPGTHARLIGQPVRGRTIALAMGFYDDYLDPVVRQALERACAVFERAGARVVPLEIPRVQDIYDAQQRVLKAEAYATHREALDAGAPYDPEVRARLLAGASVTSADYLHALSLRAVARQSFDEVLAQADIILCATCGIAAPLLDTRVSALGGADYPTPWLLTRLTAPTNFSGHPSLSVPFGADPHALPLGVQLIGPHGAEDRLYQYAQVLEAGV